MNPVKRAAEALKIKIGDDKLTDSLFQSYSELGSALVANNAMRVLQNVGLFVESEVRVVEHIVLGTHTPLSRKFELDQSIRNLEKSSGNEGLRILAARLSRVVYDFRTRKKSVHLKDIDPLMIDATLAYNICTWVFIEILKEIGLSETETYITILATRKTPLVAEVGGILRTTDPALNGAQRLLLLLYAAQTPLTEDQLLQGTQTKIRTKDHLRTNLKNLEKRDTVHGLENHHWIIFGRGIEEAEQIISRRLTK